VEREYFGTTSNGAPVYLLRLESASGVRAEVIEYGATSDTPTIVDLSSQLYFNLSRGMQSGVMDHDLWIAAEEIVERDGDGAATAI
jgi:galactose mutarotase-like enzyme